jgi:hypothetical protein
MGQTAIVVGPRNKGQQPQKVGPLGNRPSIYPTLETAPSCNYLSGVFQAERRESPRPGPLTRESTSVGDSLDALNSYPSVVNHAES